MVKITPESIRKYLKKWNPDWTERKLNSEVNKQMGYVNKVLNTSPVKEAVIIVNWSDNHNAQATCNYKTKDGKYHTISSTWTKGAGYDKESTAVGDILYKILLPNLVQKRVIPKNDHIRVYNNGYHLPAIDVSGVGMRAVESVVKALGGNWSDLNIKLEKSNHYSMNFK